MIKRALSSIVCCTIFSNAYASDLDVALQKTYMSCMGIEDMLSDMKTLAGINTAVTGVGTVAGGAALVVGIKKAQTLKELDRLRDIEENGDVIADDDDDKIVISYQKDFKPNLKAQARAKKLGNWRTGLLAVNTVTNVAGAVIASKNTENEDLENKIQSCIKSVSELQPVIMQAKMDGADVTEAQNIYRACSEYKYIDLSDVYKRAKGATVSSVVGGGTGAAGAIVSHIANNSNGEKEQKLDTVSNVLAGGATVLTGAATVFNALQISAIKKVSEVSEQCESLLR